MSIQSCNLIKDIKDIKALQDQLTCPVFLEPLLEAVSLIPCAHKIQQVAAKELYGETHNGWEVKTGKLCPICRVSVVGYMVDHSLRNIASQFLEISGRVLNLIIEAHKEKLGKISLSVSNSESVERDYNRIRKLPYPGNSASFFHNYGSWQPFNSPTDLCKTVTFKSATPESLITDFELLGYKDGSVSLSLQFIKTCNRTEVATYLKNFDIIAQDDNFLKIGIYKSKNPVELINLFTIIAENNEIPAPYFEQLENIITGRTH